MAANPVHCFLCLNVTGAQVTATTMVGGYQVCDEHALLENLVLTGDDTISLPGSIATARHRAGISPLPRKGRNL